MSSLNEKAASDKESYKKSLAHVNKFLEKIGESIQFERNYLHKIDSRLTTLPIITQKVDGANIKEDYPAQLYDGIHLNEHPRLKSGEIKGSKELVNDDVSKSTANDIHKQVQDKLKEQSKVVNSKNKNRANKNGAALHNKHKLVGNKMKKLGRGNSEEHDIFFNMEFPAHNDLPVTGSLITTPSTPAVLNPDFTFGGVEGGPAAETLGALTSTTDFQEMLLNPKDFGYTTTRKRISGFGDMGGSTYIDPKILTTTPVLTVFPLGPFSTTFIKLYDIIITKPEAVVRRLVWGFARVMETYHRRGKLDEFGEPTKRALLEKTTEMDMMQPDERRTHAIMLKDLMEHRGQRLTREVNTLIDNIDSLYKRDEHEDLVRTLKPLIAFNNKTVVPYTLLEKFMKSVFAPWDRLKDTFRRSQLKDSLNRIVKKYFYPTSPYRRQNVKSDDDLEVWKPRIPISRNDGRQSIVGDVKDNVERRNVRNSRINLNITADKKTEEDEVLKNDNILIIEKRKKIKEIMDQITKSSTKETVRLDDENENGIEFSEKTESPQDIDKETSPLVQSTKKHHKKHHQKHRHTHRNIRHKLMKLLKIFKLHNLRKSKHKRYKHRRHHHKHKSGLRTNKNDDRIKSSEAMDNEEATKVYAESKPNNNSWGRFDFIKDILATTTVQIPFHYFYRTTQVYEIKDIKKSRRNMRPDNEAKKAVNLRERSTESDDEVYLKANLYKAMALTDIETLNFEGAMRAREKKKILLGSSEDCASYEEAFLKKKIYEYFKNTPDL